MLGTYGTAAKAILEIRELTAKATPSASSNAAEPYRQSIEWIVVEQQTDSQRGFSRVEAKARLQAHGLIVLLAKKQVP